MFYRLGLLRLKPILYRWSNTYHLTDEDNQAIAAYLTHLSGGSKAGSMAAQSPVVMTETERMLNTADPSLPLGAQLYLDNCGACHAMDGRGAPEIFPRLDGNDLVTADLATGLIHVILHGAELPSTEHRPAALRMQAHGWRLNDEEVAALATFIRQGWHNQASAVSASEVQPLR